MLMNFRFPTDKDIKLGTGTRGGVPEEPAGTEGTVTGRVPHEPE